MKVKELINAVQDAFIERFSSLPLTDTRWGVSEKSGSRYITVYREGGEYDDEYGFLGQAEFKIRISDHELPSYYDAPDYEITIGQIHGGTHVAISDEDDFDDAFARTLEAAERAFARYFEEG